MTDEACPYCKSPCTFYPNCHCGCGQLTSVVKKACDVRSANVILGKPSKFTRGHTRRSLTPTQVREIRLSFIDSKIPVKALAYKLGKQYGVNTGAVLNIIYGTTYKYVTPEVTKA